MPRRWAAAAAFASAASPRRPSEAAQERAGRCAVGADDLQRQADQLVPARFDGAEIESLDRDDPCVEQGSVGVLISDREVVDPDEPDPHLDEQAGARAVEPDEVAG